MTDDKVDTEKAILNAARQVFVRKGLDGARMQEIADEAGMNKALLHYYFRSKEKLFKMVFREAMSKFFPGMVVILGSSEIPIEKKVEAFIENYIKIIQENPFIPSFIIGELNKNPEQLTEFFVESGIDTSKVAFILKEVIAKELGITIQQARHLVVNIIALCVFPFVGRPLLEKIIFQSNQDEFDQFISERKAVILNLIRTSINRSV
ncbi:TetR/AcrR family transcriptional regulator [Perlabentimonas gracilis]|uniref:TetR/AcrR family transcriptional regulator n=1 Tax=Perlabentimonas gracilis TaxID=2715279 RepID=UPI0014080609|nr:TetR/AcrR family transcriptional regulator [Perlabentimonas gracilis]NHB67266.1 TetR/AcrR family transcriptional regulator [Perlabentimonas gracilis]